VQNRLKRRIDEEKRKTEVTNAERKDIRRKSRGILLILISTGNRRIREIGKSRNLKGGEKNKNTTRRRESRRAIREMTRILPFPRDSYRPGRKEAMREGEPTKETLPLKEKRDLKKEKCNGGKCHF